MERRKKQNVFVSYFVPFGIRQICDFLMLAGFVVIIIGLIVSQAVVTVGLAIFMAASALALFRTIKVLISPINHRSPEWRNALINTVIMGVLFALATFGFIWALIVVL